MGFITTDILDILGLAYAIVGLALLIPICFVFKLYFRFHDHVQFLYLFFLAFTATSPIFSSYTQISWASIQQNFFAFCVTGDLVCTLGFQLSFTVCLIGTILIAFIITKIVACKREQAQFQPVYRFLKPVIRWTYIPLVYYSLYYLILSIQGTSNYLIESVVVFAVCAVFPICQLIAYKCIQKQNQRIWPKWLQFFNYLQALLIPSLIAIGKALNNSIPYYFVYGVIVLHTIAFCLKHHFAYKVVGRVLFILGECCLVTIFSFFVFKTSYLMDFHLDLFLLSGVLLFDLIFYIMLIVFYCKHGIPKDTESEKINPEDSEAERIQKRNSYNVELEDVDNQFTNNRKKYKESSYDELRESQKSGNLQSSKIAKTRRKR